MLKLIYRDLFIYQTRNLIIMPAFALFFTFGVFGTEQALLFSSMAIIALFGFTMTATTAFALDETTKFQKFLRATPISTHKIVLSRYLSCLLSGAAGAVIVIIYHAVASFIPGELGEAIAAKTFTFSELIILAAILALYSAVLMPIIFKFDYNKIRYFLILLYMLIVLIGISLMNIPFIYNIISGIAMYASGALGTVLFLIISLALFFLSIKVSSSIFNKKEV